MERVMPRREEEVIEKAQQQVESHRLQRRGEFFLQGIVIWWVFALLALFLIPWPLPNKVWVAVHGLCAQRSGHMLLFGGQILPLCARDSGYYAGALLGAIYLLARGRWHAAGRPTRAFWWAFFATLAFYGADVANSVADDWFGWQVYPPQNWLRLASGLLLGLSTAVLLLWVINLAFASRQRERSILPHWADLLGLAAAGTAGGLAFWSGWPALFVPLDVLSVGGLVLLLWAGNAFLFLTVARGRNLLRAAWEATPFLFWGGIAAVAEMALLSFLRYRIGA